MSSWRPFVIVTAVALLGFADPVGAQGTAAPTPLEWDSLDAPILFEELLAAHRSICLDDSAAQTPYETPEEHETRMSAALAERLQPILNRTVPGGIRMTLPAREKQYDPRGEALELEFRGPVLELGLGLRDPGLSDGGGGVIWGGTRREVFRQNAMNGPARRARLQDWRVWIKLPRTEAERLGVLEADIVVNLTLGVEPAESCDRLVSFTPLEAHVTADGETVWHHGAE